MSSTESYAARRNELLKDIEDQVTDGVYETEPFTTQVRDVVSGSMVTVTAVRIKLDVSGKVVHATDSPLSLLGIKTYNLSINEVKYDPTVGEELKAQQQAVAAVQISCDQVQAGRAGRDYRGQSRVKPTRPQRSGRWRWNARRRPWQRRRRRTSPS